MKEKSDEALAAETDDKARLLGMITLDQWRDVLAVEGRGAVLSVAAAGGWDSVLVYLEQIKGSACSGAPLESAPKRERTRGTKARQGEI